MRLSRRPELKIDGFRSLAYVENGQCDLVSRNGHTFRNFKDLAQWIGENLRVESAVLDGEIACVDDSGRPDLFDSGRRDSHFHCASINGTKICVAELSSTYHR